MNRGTSKPDRDKPPKSEYERIMREQGKWDDWVRKKKTLQNIGIRGWVKDQLTQSESGY